MNTWFGPVIDISHWQGIVDPVKALLAGVKGIYIKAGGINKYYGSNYTDPQWGSNSDQFPNYLPTGYYWYFHPHFSGKHQAEYFGDLLKKAKWHLPPAVDVEENYQQVSRAKYQEELKGFLDRLGSLLPGVDQVIYTRGLYWNENLGNPSWASEKKLWIARYSTWLQHPWEDSMKYKPSPWEDYWMWQWSADGNGCGSMFGVQSEDIDMNRVNMTEDAFYEMALWKETAESGLKHTYEIQEVSHGIDIKIREKQGTGSYRQPEFISS